MRRDAMTDSREVRKKAVRATTAASDPMWHFGRDDSAGNNETCSRAPTDLRGSPEMLASLTGSIIPEL